MQHSFLIVTRGIAHECENERGRSCIHFLIKSDNIVLPTCEGHTLLPNVAMGLTQFSW
jgi:hypothetical protein